MAPNPEQPLAWNLTDPSHSLRARSGAARAPNCWAALVLGPSRELAFQRTTTPETLYVVQDDGSLCVPGGEA